VVASVISHLLRFEPVRSAARIIEGERSEIDYLARHAELETFCWRMISAQTRSAFVARENRCPLFRIML